MKKFEGMILGCDMDGTLLDSNRKISPQNQQALQYFTQEGGRFSLATGRAPKAIQPYIPQLPFNAPYSLLNGSLLLDASHQIMDCAGMPNTTIDLIQTVLSNFSQFGCEIFAGELVFVRQMNDITQNHMDVLDMQYCMVSQEELCHTERWCKINFTASPDRIQALKEFLAPYAGQFCIASSTPTFCEITARDVNKGSALKRIANACGIAENRIFAIGDSYNDQSMLEAAAVSFAPANADADIIQTATVTVKSNDEDAVADAIGYIEAHFC